MVVGRRGSGLMMGFLVCLFVVGLGGCGGVVKSVTWMGLNLLVFFFAASCPTPDCALRRYALLCALFDRHNEQHARCVRI